MLPTHSDSFGSSSEDEDNHSSLSKDQALLLDPLGISRLQEPLVAHPVGRKDSDSSSCEDEVDPLRGLPLPGLSKGPEVMDGGSSSDESAALGKGDLVPFPAVVEFMEDDQNKILLAEINKVCSGLLYPLILMGSSHPLMFVCKGNNNIALHL